MEALHLNPNLDFIVPVFYARIVLHAHKLEIKKKFDGYPVSPIQTQKGLDLLEIRIPGATLNGFFNSHGVCYTCWIAVDTLTDVKPCILFYNQCFEPSAENQNYWQDGDYYVELVQEKEGWFIVVS